MTVGRRARDAAPRSSSAADAAPRSSSAADAAPRSSSAADAAPRSSSAADAAPRSSGCGRRAAVVGGGPRGRRALELLDSLRQRAERRIEVGARRADQRKLELGASVGAGAQVHERVGQEVERAHERRRCDGAGLIGETLVALGGQPQLRGDRAVLHLDDQQLPRVRLELADERRRVASAVDRFGGRREGAARILTGDGVERPEQQVGIRDPEHREHISKCDLRPRVGLQLVERAERVPKAAGRVPCQHGGRLGADRDRLSARDALHDDGDLLDRRPLEVEAVAAIDDGRQDLLGVGGREHEHGVRRRLLERLQERVPRRRREHVRLVEDVDLLAPRHRRVRDRLAQRADVVHRVRRRGIHLDDVERARRGDRDAGVADAARRDGRPVDAVETRGQDLRHRRLPGAARANEQVCVMHAIAFDGVGQRAHDVLLPHHLGEGPGTVAAVERGAC